jgi:hypothetical protein
MGSDDIFKTRKVGREKRKMENKLLRSRVWLIASEGEKTEPNYFRGLIDRINDLAEPRLRIIYEFGAQGMNTESLVKSLDRFFKMIDEDYGTMNIPYGNIIIAFDRDSFGKDQFNRAIARAEKLQRRPDVNHVYSAWSNESFELWLYLHFNYLESALGREEINDKLTDILRRAGKLSDKESYVKEGKSRSTIYQDIIKSGGSLSMALKNAKALSLRYDSNSFADHNPCTKVYEAVEALAKDAGVDIKDI